MSLFAVMLLAGSLVSAFLVLHHLAAIKQNGDDLLSAYRRTLAAARARLDPPAAPPDAYPPGKSRGDE